jgi:hypothetical protein
MGKSDDELKAHRFAHEAVKSSIASAASARSFIYCRCRLSEAMQTQSFNAASRFGCCCCFEYM